MDWILTRSEKISFELCQEETKEYVIGSPGGTTGATFMKKTSTGRTEWSNKTMIIPTTTPKTTMIIFMTKMVMFK